MSSATPDRETLPYRPGAGVMLINRENQVFVAQRLDSTLEAWQMPQGGLDDGEDAEDGALRELEEETGITRDKVEVIARAPEVLLYDLPEDLVGKLWKGKWRGQRQHWFLCRFRGEDSDIDIETEHPEFRAWRWADPETLPAMIVPFKRDLYEKVLHAFREWLR
ncbi:RNA pyrophosphohydrolase [Sphingosinicella sp. BN140058]|uniref:RNA pyrophosphohydrolase n=1 Tax=Sphingosinicella sp. BN140058 TaxID=1892855 RepID=UPI001010E5E4|nr:RNA pyrophosphohydrolase [Sphingosinicella sp. BN140058]QAY78591.1 RNA pyrophosphohydrolase [Sphingosinicella sp. BN140058]